MEVAGVGLALSAAQTLFAALQCSELKELFTSNLESLESLERSVTAIKAVLLDADSKQANGLELSAQEHNFIEEIKDVVYDADDLLDAYVTQAQLQHIRMESGNKLSRTVRGLFKKVTISSPEIKKIAKRLVEIGRYAQNFKFDYLPIRREREETCSYVNENQIVGREDDQRRIVDMLLDSAVLGDLPVLAIVGVGGLGKTALVQLVYNDPRIQNEFSLRWWVCVSDQGGNQFNAKAILADIYKLVNPDKCVGDLKFQVLVQELRSKLDQNKYLLVLDDLWNEKSDECLLLVDILIGQVQRGSRIVVTTRSKKTASAIGSSRPYELRGLSDEDSWRLFELKVGREIEEGHDLFEICKDIVKKCVNVPLAIKVVGSLLCDLPENEWRSFQQSRLIEIKNDDNDIMQILKFSYYHLSPSLKSCFTYCALFPKDLKILKEKLIRMWMANDYVTDEVQAEYYFQILVQRCFFQDIRKIRYKTYKFVEFKIHDLMHDMAQEVAGKEIFIANSATTKLDKKIRHLYDGAPWRRTKGFVTPAKIRSYVHGSYVSDESDSNIQFLVSTVLAKWRHLRVLHLHQLGIRQLPDAIGELLHLRHLDLSLNRRLKMLPEALTKLINLQILDLDDCSGLKELPRDFNKLVHLRTLYVPDELEYMPLGMAKMTRLTRLNRFALGQRKSCLRQEDRLEDFRFPRNLKGSLGIEVTASYKHAKEYCGEGGYICKTEHLNSICMYWEVYHAEERVGNDEDVLEALQPHRNLKDLEIRCYRGVRIPRWAREHSLTTTLPNLVTIHLARCDGLQELPWIGRLQHLKTLKLEYLENVEYMENRTSIGSSSNDGAVASNSSRAVESSLFFPSLEKLKLEYMPKLKGWWRGMSNSTSEIVNSDSSMVTTPAHPLPSFPRLSNLTIYYCPNLTSIPLCPVLETLFLRNLNERFRILIEEDENGVGRSSSSSSSNDSGNWRSHYPKMREINTDKVSYLKSLPMVAFQCASEMIIARDNKVESLSEAEQVFRGCSSSLRSLELWGCKNLRSVSPGGLEYLTALEQLSLSNLPKLSFDETDGTGKPWRCLGKCLRSLKLLLLEKVVNLPKGLRYLTALQSLKIYKVPLKDVPEWIECLSSLHSLQIKDCKHLESLPTALRKLTSLKEFELSYCDDTLNRRCEKPDGDYWPIIENIQNFHILS